MTEAEEEPEPLRILCYGDSNTWGCEAITYRRFGARVRWTGVVQRELDKCCLSLPSKTSYQILEEGLSGRTTVWDDPLSVWLPPNDDPSVCNGRKSLMPILHSAKPLAAVVLYLGANDLKERYNNTPMDIATGVSVLATKIRQAQAGLTPSRPLPILIVCPPPCTNEEFFQDLKGAIAKSKRLPEYYETMVNNLGAGNDKKDCYYLDAGAVPGVVCDGSDGLHLTKEAHGALGLAIATKLKEMLGLPQGLLEYS